MRNNHNNWHRRHAIQIAAQLPEEPADALLVLDLARELVEKFLVVQTAPQGRQEARLLPFRRLAA